ACGQSPCRAHERSRISSAHLLPECRKSSTRSRHRAHTRAGTTACFGRGAVAFDSTTSHREHAVGVARRCGRPVARPLDRSVARRYKSDPGHFARRFLSQFWIDGRVLTFALLVTLGTGVIFGLVPAVKGAGENE